jgi:excisionase family DNA binding protein
LGEIHPAPCAELIPLFSDIAQNVVTPIYTIDEAAEILKIKPRTVRQWIADRKLKSFKLGDLVRIHEDDIQALIDTARKEKRLKYHDLIKRICRNV